MTRMNPKRIPVLALATLAALAAGCDSPTDPPLIYVQPQTLEAVGDAIQLVATPSQGELPFWESLDTAIVSVTSAGMARAVAPGTARVRARLGSRTAEGTVVVMEPVDVRISNFRVLTNAAGDYTGMAMQLRNVGGRGYYRLQFWKERADGEAEHRPVLSFSTDTEAPVGMDYQSTINGVPAQPADWVVAYSRAPNDIGFVRTACIRLDGGQPCPMP